MGDDPEIAIVGVGCRFPGANNLSEFWRVLSNGENHVKEIPKEKWDVDQFYDEDPTAPGKTNVRCAGFVKSHEPWDCRFFDINEIEAETIDPQQRMTLDCVHMALENGGITKKDINGTQTGVFIGCMNDDYKLLAMGKYRLHNNYTATGMHTSVVSARVSYVYNLLGPAETIDTACSSSLVAIHNGGQALRLGECNLAICGGVNSILDPDQFGILSKAGILSPTGQCKPFSASADGYARSEGCGIVVLKRLKDAIRDENLIWGILKTGTNQDGRTYNDEHMPQAITTPSGLQQTKLLKNIYSNFREGSVSVQVIEAHGTGTHVGDPIEANALGRFFSNEANSRREIMIGSVKSNIGHTEGAAGVAGLIKVLLMMKHEVIVPSLMYSQENENPKINFSKYGLKIPTVSIPWQKSTNAKVACVNSFGFGGTNAHAVVHDYANIEKAYQTLCNTATTFPIVTISASNQESLKENIKIFSEHLKENEYEISALAFTSTVKRDHRPYRKAYLPNDKTHLIQLCNQRVLRIKPDKHKVVFVFSGVGTVWNGMCISMMTLPSFRKAIQSIDTFLLPLAGWKIETRLIEKYDIEKDPMTAHIAIFACQIGLLAVLEEFGISPDAVVGQSVGEVAAAFGSGSIDLKTAIKIIFFRSKYLAEVVHGTMAVVKSVSVDKIKEFCDNDENINIAVFNSSQSCTVAGDIAAIDRLTEHLNSGNKDNVIKLKVSCAYHSPSVGTAASKIRSSEHLQDMKCKVPTYNIPMTSTVSGKEEPPETFVQNTYWEKNIRDPVLFSSAIKSISSKTGPTLFVELGPNPVLSVHLEYIFQGSSNHLSVASMRKGDDNTFARAICTLYEHGVDPIWKKIVPEAHLTDIPRYAFRSDEILYKRSTIQTTRERNIASSYHMYIERDAQDHSYHVTVDEITTPLIFEHIVNGMVTVPGAFYADIGFELGKSYFGQSCEDTTVSLEFPSSARVEKHSKINLEIDEISCSNNQHDFLVKHDDVVKCIGKVRKTCNTTERVRRIGIEHVTLALKMQDHFTSSSDQMYQQLLNMGINHGKSFQIMKNCTSNGSHCVVDIELDSVVLRDLDKTTIHPCVLDGMLQSVVNVQDPEVKRIQENESLVFVPVAIEKLTVYGKPTKTSTVYAVSTNVSISNTVIKLHYDIMLLNQDGTILIEITNFMTYCRRDLHNTPDELKYRMTLTPSIKPQWTKRIPNMLVIDFSNESSLEQYSQQIMVYRPNHDHPQKIEEYVETNRVALDKMEAVVAMFGKEQTPLDLRFDSSNLMGTYQNSIQNCMRLMVILRCGVIMDKTPNVPLFIVTQNTQHIPNTTETNLCGSEVWGFIRNIQLELFGKITLVDLNPSFQETHVTFFGFIEHSIKAEEDNRTEYVIANDEVFCYQFSKTDMTNSTPEVRESVRGDKTMRCGILSEAVSEVREPYLSLDDAPIDILYDRSRYGDAIEIELESFYAHNSLLYPVTSSAITDTPTNFQNSHSKGHEIYAIEYTGLPINSQKDPVIVVYPHILKTIMNVPKECAVDKKYLPFYRPGLLTKSIILWEMACLVPLNSNVALVHDDSGALFQDILKPMLTPKDSNMVTCDVDNVDVVLLTCKLDEKEMALRDLFMKTQCVICIRNTMSGHLYELLTMAGKSVFAVDPKEIFHRATFSHRLKQVYHWLLTNVPASSILNERDISSEFNVSLPFKKPIGRLFEKTYSYIITGGLTGLGWELLLLLAELGAGSIACLSRNVKKKTTKEIKEVEIKYKCTIVRLEADVTSLQSIQRALKELQEMPQAKTIRGVFHGAGVLDSRLLDDLEESHLRKVMCPKILGVLNMHIATLHLDLDFFVAQSSIASYIGLPGQANYGAANTFLDAFSRLRRHNGLPAQSVNWGALSVGMAANESFKENFQKRGYRLLHISEIRDCFLQALMEDSTEVVYANIDWTDVARDYSRQQMTRVGLQFETLFKKRNIISKQLDDRSFNIDSLRHMNYDTQIRYLSEMVQDVARRVMSSEHLAVDMKSTFATLGMDSMATVMFANIIFDITQYRLDKQIMRNYELCLVDIVTLLHENLFQTHAAEDATQK